MACPPGNCSAWAAFRLCKPLPPIVIDGSYTPKELQLLWFCWRARSTGEYGGTTPVDLGFDSPGLIDISQTTNIAKVIAYCESRGTLVRQFTNFSRFGFKFNLPNFQASGSFSTWSGGVFGGATSPGGGGGGSGGGGEDPVGSDPTGGGTSGGGGGGAATCPCVADNGSDLTVVVCQAMDCTDGSPKLKVTVCGGTPPYRWSIAGGEGDPVATQAGTNNRNANVTPPENPDPDLTGVAFQKGYEVIRRDVCPPNSIRQFALEFGCDSAVIGTCFQSAFGVGAFPVACFSEEVGLCDACCAAICADGSACDTALFTGVRDNRATAGISSDCLPCSISTSGVILTATDDNGDSVSTTVTGV